MDKHEVISKLLELIENSSEIENALNKTNLTIAKTFVSCYSACRDCKNIDNSKIFEIDSIIDYLHDELHTGHWSDSPLHFRTAFSAASFIKSIIILKESENFDLILLRNSLKAIDLGILLGAPLELNPQLLTRSASIISEQIKNKTDNKENLTSFNSNKKRKTISECNLKFQSLKGIEIESLSCPSLETFSRYFNSQKPVKLLDCMTHWPAITKWLDLNYLLEIAGDRTVPIEIGSNYTDENWHQKLVTLKEFIKQYFLESTSDNKLGYLAQHNLFNQITELKNDIHIPEYCCLGESDLEPDINAWFGPAGTVSPLHQDPKNNILCQIFGTKQLILFDCKDTQYLYPHEEPMLSNTSRIDPLNPDLDKFKDFPNAILYKCLLEPGEMIFIPEKWWHHVTAIDKSFSVSFWWN